mgnify:CR=1 FL=1
MNQKSGTSKASVDKLVKTIRRKTRQTYFGREYPHCFSGPSRRGNYFGAMPPGGHIRKPVLQLVKGIPRSRETPSGQRYGSSGDVA